LKQVVIYHLIVVAAALVWLSCAGQMPPSGGPPDTTPPTIIASQPTPRATNFSGQSVHLQFSERIDRRSLQESIFISPSVGQLEFDWDGDAVQVRFADTLRPNTTYILTVGTDVRDTRGNNRMANAFSLPFATGAHVDTAEIAGKVFDEKPTGVMIFAYQLQLHAADTLDPRSSRPDYLTQTGKDGAFVLPYLAFGTYRLIAVRDEMKSLRYAVQVDQYGMASADVTLRPDVPTVTGIQFRLTKEDTTAPFLSSARALDRKTVLVRLSEPMDTTRTDRERVGIVDTVAQSPLGISDATFVGLSNTEIRIATAEQHAGVAYRITLSGFRDASGNELSGTSNSADFVGSALPDTTPPRMIVSTLADTTKPFHPRDTLLFVFSEPIRMEIAERGVSITDSLGEIAMGQWTWWNPALAMFLPSSPFLLGAKYTLTVHMDSIIDLVGNSYHDSTLVGSFHTIDPNVLSSIHGDVQDAVDEGGRIFVTATEVSGKKVKPRTVVVDSSGAFALDQLQEGEYALTAFRDRDGNGRYSFGRPFPFEPSERFVNYPDTLKLRARWPMEGVVIRLQR
jgi:hypothetical protein